MTDTAHIHLQCPACDWRSESWTEPPYGPGSGRDVAGAEWRAHRATQHDLSPRFLSEDA